MKRSIELGEVDKKIQTLSESLTFWSRVKSELNQGGPEGATAAPDTKPVARRPGRPTKNKMTEGWTAFLPKILAGSEKSGGKTVREIQAALKEEGYPVIYQTIYGAVKRGVERGDMLEVGNKFRLRNN